MKANKHSLLNEIAASLGGSQPTTDVSFGGHTYTMSVLKPEAEEWAFSQVSSSTPLAMSISLRLPLVAASIQAIDGLPVEQLITPSNDIEPEVRQAMLADVRAMRKWRRGQMLEFLLEDTDETMIEALYESYQKLSRGHKEALKNAANFTKTTP